MSGRLLFFLPAWQQITSDKFVLEVIRQGYSLPFVRPPPLPLSCVKTSDVGRGFVPPNQEGRGDCRSVVGPGGILFPLLPGYQAHWWVSPHPQATRTQLIYMSCQVLYVNPHLYSAESSHRLVDGVAGSQGHLHVPIHPNNWRYLRFALRNQVGEFIVYQRKVLPFGFSTAPRVFTKLLAPPAAHLHLQGCLMYPQIDDIFHAQTSDRQTDSTHP